MGLQLIFVVETNKKNKSDWMYIRKTIDHFYKYNDANLKLNVVYMDGRNKYIAKENEIKKLVAQYEKTGKSIVIMCFDCDEYQSKPEDKIFLENAEKHCNEKGYRFVWFCKDIEHVYLGMQIESNQKQKKAVSFFKSNLIKSIDIKMLSYSKYQNKASNIAKVIDDISHKYPKHIWKNENK